MRGPYERLKYDGRRLWECPLCHHRERSPGSVTSVVCKCQANEPAAKRITMRLVEEGFRQYLPRALPMVPETAAAGKQTPAQPNPESDSGSRTGLSPEQ